VRTGLVGSPGRSVLLQMDDERAGRARCVQQPGDPLGDFDGPRDRRLAGVEQLVLHVDDH
jgi:hypothetical protein